MMKCCFEICFDEHYVELSFHDLLERVCEEHDTIEYERL
jgi:hypothetical protein